MSPEGMQENPVVLQETIDATMLRWHVALLFYLRGSLAITGAFAIPFMICASVLQELLVGMAIVGGLATFSVVFSAVWAALEYFGERSVLPRTIIVRASGAIEVETPREWRVLDPKETRWFVGDTMSDWCYIPIGKKRAVVLFDGEHQLTYGTTHANYYACGAADDDWETWRDCLTELGICRIRNNSSFASFFRPLWASLAGAAVGASLGALLQLTTGHAPWTLILAMAGVFEGLVFGLIHDVWCVSFLGNRREMRPVDFTLGWGLLTALAVGFLANMTEKPIPFSVPVLPMLVVLNAGIAYFFARHIQRVHRSKVLDRNEARLG